MLLSETLSPDIPATIITGHEQHVFIDLGCYGSLPEGGVLGA